MPKNTHGGNKAKKGKNIVQTARNLVFKQDGEMYGQIKKKLGGSRFEIYCIDKVIRQGCLRGNMRKRVWINDGDIVLISTRDYQDNIVDIIYKYTSDEAHALERIKEIEKDFFTITNDFDHENQDTECNIVFAEADEVVENTIDDL